MNRKSFILLRGAACSVFAGAFALTICIGAKAGVVKPSGLTDKTDKMAIQKELDATGSVTLMSGKTYRLTGPLDLKNNMTINADGATIIADIDIMMNRDVSKTNYASLSNVTVNGGTWISPNAQGYDKTSIKFAHASDIRLSNMTVKHANYSGHTIELIACRNVTIENCVLKELGKPTIGNVDECIQLDIAAPTTAPSLTKVNPALANGACCQNITIKGCTVFGNRGICANWAANDSKSNAGLKNQYHSGIRIENCKVTGAGNEALALFNVKDAKVIGNKLISKAPNGIGLHMSVFGNQPCKNVTISKNTMKGKRNGLLMWSEGGKYKKVTIKNNKLYAKNKAGFNLGTGSTIVAAKTVYKGNKNYSMK